MITIKTKAVRCSGRCGQSYPVEHLERVGRGRYCSTDAKWERRYAAADAEKRRAEIVAEVEIWAAVMAGRRAYERWAGRRDEATEPTYPSGAQRRLDPAWLDLARRERGEGYVRMLLGQETR